MARDFDGTYQPSAKARKQQEKDQRRMNTAARSKAIATNVNCSAN